MNNKYIVTTLLWALLGNYIEATIPPVVANRPDSLIQKDEMTRVYLSPTRIVWMEGNIRNSQFLLKKGDGQAEMGKRNMAEITNEASSISSVVLDFGCELHGGVQLVLGGSSSRKPQRMRIRFG